MLRLGFRLDSLAVVGAGAIAIGIPSEDFSWASFTVYASGANYGVTVNFPALCPTPDFIYYLSPTGSAVASPANDDPLTPITPRRFVTLANANGGNVLGRCASGFSFGNVGFDGNALSCASVILEPWVGQQSTAPGYPVMVKRSTNLPAPWTHTTGTTYSTPHSTANTPVYDFANLDANGIPMRLTAAPDLATCQATPGSEFFESGTSLKHVTPIDGRNLVGDTMMIVPTSGNCFAAVRTTNQTVWMKGIWFVGPVLHTQATAAQASNFYHQDCMFLGTGGNSVAILGPITSIGLSAKGGGALQDFLNYTGNVQGDPKFLEYRTRMIRSGYDAGGTNNASTSHNNGIGIRVDCDYVAQNRVVNDANNSKAWMIGTRVRASASSDATAISVAAGTADGQTVTMFLDDCIIDPSVTADLHAYTGSSIHCANMDISGLVKTGGGTIDTYVRG